MNGLALCAGIGGLELGIGLAVPGYRSVCYVEREAPAAALLVAAMQNGILDEAPVWSDLATFDGRRWRGVVDLVSAGYPCQPFSVAGKRRGEADERHLWPHVARIIGEVEPVLVFLENVPGHLQLGFERVVADLRGMGYSVAAGLFTAAEVGAPHRRERLFALAYRQDGDGRVLLQQWRPFAPGAESGGSGGSVADTARPVVSGLAPARTGRLGDSGAGDMGHADAAGLEGRGLSECGRSGEWPSWPPGPADDWTGIDPRLWPAVGDAGRGNGHGRPGRSLAEQEGTGVAPASGAHNGEAAESPLCRVADGPPARIDLLRALGNAVVPAVAAKAFRTLAGVLA